jgi:retron-type reverse transcriptase
MLAHKKARKNKSSRLYVREFEKNLERNLFRLESELRQMIYEPQPMKTFIIRDPKTRVISASAFRDRVVHHALYTIIEPIFEKSFICDSYANRKRKGTHAALRRFDIFKRKVSGNGKLIRYAKDSNHVYGYVLKADIKHYFDSVDHEVMMRIISRKIQDEKVLWLIGKILNNQRNKGMPIGNLTSQFFANIYLSELDYFVKHRLKAKYYIRYVDDFAILDASKEKLDFYKYEISEFLKSIKLELHPQKSRIIPLQKGIVFLGFHVFYRHKLLKKGSLRIIKQRVKSLIEIYENGLLDKEEIAGRVEGWNAYAMHANTYKLRTRIMEELNDKIK